MSRHQTEAPPAEHDAAVAAMAAELGAQTPLLEQIAGHTAKPGGELLEDVQTFALGAGAAECAELSVPSSARDIQVSVITTGTVFVFDGDQTEQAAALVPTPGAGVAEYVPCLFLAGAGAEVGVRRPEYTGRITVYSPAGADVTIRVRGRVKG